MNEVGIMNLYKMVIDIELRNFKKYVTLLDEVGVNEINELTKRYNNVSEDDDIWRTIISEEIFQLETQFPNIIRKSLFLSIHAYVESELLKYCSFIQTEYEAVFSVSDLKYGIVKRVKLYLEKVGRFDFHNLNNIFNEYSKYYSIRNAFSHTNAADDELDKKQINAIKELDNIEIINNNVVINNKFIFNYLDMLNKLFELLYETDK